MSLQRILSRFSIVVLGVVLAMTASPALPASSHEVEPPPFELRFPQETYETEFGSTFGARRSGGRRHRGNDLMAPKMTEVYAAAPGIVTTVGSSRRAGRYVEIDHLGGWSSMYAHLNNDTPGTDDGDAPWHMTVAPGVTEGSWVQAGQLIGWVGDSGNAEGANSHTHFELARDGHEVDPYDYLRAAFDRDHRAYLSLFRASSPDFMV
ncbi:MAG: M23 family metallopeptidase [Acidimicrobiia bacterium]